MKYEKVGEKCGPELLSQITQIIAINRATQTIRNGVSEGVSGLL